MLADEAVDCGADQTPGTADDVRWTLGDHLNSVRDWAVYDDRGTATLADDTVTIVKHVVYDAFGNVIDDWAPGVESLLLYTARPFDAKTHLQNNLNRWCDATIGRWLSVDPIGFAAGDANLYRYVGNSVTWAVDPWGLDGMISRIVDGYHVRFEICKREGSGEFLQSARAIRRRAAMTWSRSIVSRRTNHANSS